MAQNLTYSLELTTEQVRAAISQVKSLLATLDPKINTKGLDKDLIAAGKNGANGIKNEFSNLGLGDFLKSQIIAGLAVQGITTALSSLTNTIKTKIGESLNLERTAISLEVLVKSKDGGKKLFKDLQELGAKTPFEFPELAGASKKLLAFGVPVEKNVSLLSKMADVAGITDTNIGGLAEVLGKVSASNVLDSTDVTQLTNYGIGIEDLASQIGVSSEEFVKLQKSGDLARNGMLKFSDVETVLTKLTSEGGRFFKGAEKGSQTLSGTLSNVSDRAGILVGKFLGLNGANVAKGSIYEKISNGAKSLLLFLESPAFEQAGMNIANSISSAFDKVGSILSNINFGVIISESQKLLTQIQPIFEKVKTFILDNLGKIDLSGVTSTFEKVKNSITKVLESIDLGKRLDGIIKFGQGIIDLGTKITSSPLFESAINTTIDLLVKGFELLGTTLNSIGNSVVGDVFKTIGEGLTAISQNQLAVDIITGFGIALGGLAIIGTITGWVTGLGAGFVALTAGIPALITGFVAFFAPVTAGFTLIAGVVGTVFTAITGFVAFVGLIPILIGVALIGLVAIFVLNFESIKNFTLGFIESVGNFFNGLGKSIESTVKFLWDTAGAIWNAGINFIYTAIVNFGINAIQTWQNLGNNIRNAITFLWEGAKTLFNNGVSALQNYITNFIPNVTNNFNNLKNTVTNTINGLWESAKSKFSEGIDGIKTTIQEMVTSVKEKFNQLKDGATTAITNIITNAKDSLSKLPEVFTNAANDAKDNLLGILRNIKLPELKFPEIKLPSIPSFATGVRNFGGGIAEFGEKGREMLRFPNGAMALAGSRMFGALPKGTDIFNNAETEKMLGSKFQTPNLDLASVTRPQPRVSNSSVNNNTNTTNNSRNQVTNNYSNNSSFLSFGLANI